MIPRLTPVDRCENIAGLGRHEIMLGVSPGAKHERLLNRYSRARSQAAARIRLVADIRAALREGAAGRAADLLIVLRRLLARSVGDALRVEATPFARRRTAAHRGQGWGRLSPQPATVARDGEGGQVLQLRRTSCGKNTAESVV